MLDLMLFFPRSGPAQSTALHAPPVGVSILLGITLLARAVFAAGSPDLPRTGPSVTELADIEARQPVQPDALFRIASVSKPITAAAVLVLVEQGRLDLDAAALDLVGSIEPPEGRIIDPRLRKITVRQLLHHTAGFDRGKSFDPMLRPGVVVEAIGSTPKNTAIVRFMLDRPLDFDPGTQYAYSNFGYCLLGRIIENVTGRPYEESVRTLVLRPAGIRDMRLGRTRQADRAKGEVCYYSPAGTAPVESVFPDVKRPVAPPYGRYYVEAMDAHGGWIASAIDLVRFTTHLDGNRAPGLLKAKTIKLIESRPAPPVSAGEPAYYGLGWMVRPKGESANWWHAGRIPGTNSLLVRTHHGMAWAAVFNSSPQGNDRLIGELDRALWKAYAEVKQWPTRDLFELYEDVGGVSDGDCAVGGVSDGD